MPRYLVLVFCLQRTSSLQTKDCHNVCYLREFILRFTAI
ncbi:hypothetical protein BFGS084_03575 [Bacteroides fragilis]|nr:hypothetical protein BFGS084_03575 [Bacteroides fragilis]